MSQVVHCRKDEYDVYIGRGRGSIFGNPWTHLAKSQAPFRVQTREEAIDNYRKWLTGEAFTEVLQDRRKQILESLPSLQGKILGCWCKPKDCHGDVLVELIYEDKYKFEEK